MNPAVPILFALCVLPLARRRDGFPLAWCVAGLAGMLLLAPALLLDSGVPSPAASAGTVAPWAGTIDPSGGNPTLSDVTFQIQPWLVHLRRELRAGRLPFWNPYQFSGAPFWSNGQSAPLFPLHLLFAVLPLQLGLVLLPWLRVTIAGAGAWALARELDIAQRAALIAAVVFPLSGMLSSFLLFPMANALCLVPWVLRETELLARQRGSGWRLGAVVGLQALGGHPETVAHTALLAALYLAVRGRGGDRRLWLRFGAALGAGALVASVQLVPLLLNVASSSRWQEWTAGARPPLAALFDSALRLVLPDLFGHPATGTWSGPFNYNATAVFAGVLALPLAWVGLRDRWSDLRWRAVAVMTVVAALVAYQVFPLRELLLLVPILNHMLHHRLLFAVDLGLALLAAAGVATLGRARARSMAVGSAAVIAALAVAWARHHEVWRASGQLSHQVRWTAWAIVGVGLLVAGASFAGRRGGRATAIVAALVGVALLSELVAAHARTNPGLPIESLLPRTPAIEFLSARGGRIAALDAALRPNAAMVHGLRDVRGDDTLKPAHYEEVYRSFAGASPYYFEPIADWRSAWLDRLGVRWVLAPPGAAPPVESWSVAFDGADARVYERPSVLPLVRWSDGGDEGLRLETAEPGRWTIGIETPTPRTVVVAETWDQGWRATLDGRRWAPVERWEGVLLAARVEPGGHSLELRYRPRGLEAGAMASLTGVFLLALWATRDVATRRRLLVAGGTLAFVATVSWHYVVLPLRHLGSTGGDFRGYHQAARALLEGRSPYLDGAFSYPPLLALVVLPLAPLPLDAARLVWFAASLIALMAAFALTYRLLGRTPPALAATAVVWGLAGTVPENLVLGQVNPFLVLLIAAAAALVAKRPAAAAAAIGVATALKVWPGALLVVFALRRQWRELAVGAGVAFILFAVPALVAGRMVEGPMSVTEQSVPMGTAAPLNVSLPALALRLADPPREGTMPAPWLEGVAPRGWEPWSRRGWLSAVVAVAVLAAAVAALVRRRTPGSGATASGATAIELGVMAAAAVLASPVCWYHYQLCQFPAAAMVLERRLAAGRWRAVALLAAFFYALTRAQPWLFGRYVDRWGWTADAPATLWVSTSVGPILAALWLILVTREARAPSSAPR